MRIISGQYKGRIIKFPTSIRPTQDKVRKALFDILGDIQGLSFLDLFAGSGSVGLEAASAGASKVVFVENEPVCLKILKNNLSFLQPSAFSLQPLDVFKALDRLAKDKAKFEIIFLDPPYFQDLAKNCLIKLASCDILAPTGLIVAQHFKKDKLPTQVGFFKLFRQSVYADTALSFYQKR